MQMGVCSPFCLSMLVSRGFKAAVNAKRAGNFQEPAPHPTFHFWGTDVTGIGSFSRRVSPIWWVPITATLWALRSAVFMEIT
jgi:hypothetical protein